MRLPQFSAGLWMLVALAVVTLMAPIAAALTDPSIPGLPAAVQSRLAPPLPTREQPLRGYQDLVEPLPMVARNLPDSASADFVTTYDQARIYSTETHVDMLNAAIDAFPDLTGETGRDFREWVQAFTELPGVVEIPWSVLEALQADPLNGDRLSNLAVAHYYAPGNRDGETVPFALKNPSDFKLAAFLEQVVRYFPESRASVLNATFFSHLHDQKDILNAWLSEHPDDVTAISLAVRHRTSGGFNTDPTQYLHHLTTSDDPRIVAIGYAWLGDVQYAKTSVNATFTARHHAWEAVEYYDRALEYSDDPSIYAARSSALEFLGEYAAAIQTQERAIELAPASVTLRLRLAELYMRKPGKEDERLASLRQARDIQRETFDIAKEQHDAPLSEVYYWVDPFALSHAIHVARDYASSRPHHAYIGYIPYGGAGGFYISMDLIPKVERRPDTTRPRFQIERAIFDAVYVSIALGDPEAISTDIALLTEFMNDQLWNDSYRSTHYYPQIEDDAIMAAQVVEDIHSAPISAQFNDIYPAVTTLRWFGLTEKAARLCRDVLELPELTPEKSNLLPCLAENAYLSGDIETAQQAYRLLEISGEYAFAREGLDRMRAGFVAQLAGDYDEAIRQYEIASLLPSPEAEFGFRTIALTRLGDVYLESGDPLKAVEMYDQAILFLDQPSFDGVFTQMGQTEQYARNNRGIARLKVLEKSTRGITCEGTAILTCDAALADFTSVVRADPYNPVYLLNQSWVERLLGNHDAAVEMITKAVAVDASLYPALNDRGVIVAAGEDDTGAERDFLAALAINPDYHTSLWNLGILELQSGPGSFIRGQRYLAKAILLNPSLETSAISYQFDDTIYRVEINQKLEPGAQWSFGAASSVTASVFGFMTLIILAFRVALYFAENTLQDKANALMQKGSDWSHQLLTARWSGILEKPGMSQLLSTATLTVLVLATIWTSRNEISGSVLAGVLLGLYAVMTAVIVHELGHALAAWKFQVTLKPAQWGPGIILALVLLPFNLHSGPFPAQQVDTPSDRAAWWIHFGGPLANIIAGMVLYLVYYFQPLPGLRLLALVQVAAAAYALLPFPPLDGAVLSLRRPWVLGTMATTLTIVGLLFSLGRL